MGLLDNFKSGILKEFQKEAEKEQTAYLKGINMDDHQLKLKYAHASGAKKRGYAQALKEKRLL